jgi:hypothetical protein
MPPRAPGVHTHEEWKGMAQPVGLVVEPVVLSRLGVFPESATTVLADWQQRLEQLLEDQPVGDQAAREQWLSVAPSFELFCQEVLAWEPGDLRKPEELAAEVAVTLDDYDEVLRPDWIVGEPSQGDGTLKAQVLVQELPLGTLFDALPKGADGRRSWEATPQQRLERLLKESEHPIGLLWNWVALRLVYAPRGESSGHLTFPLEPMTTVDGRPMLAALQMLLGPDRLFEGGASNTRLRPLMEQSRKEQNEVSTRLAEQVLEALWILLRGFDAAGLEVEDPSHIYGGLITVLRLLVFLLYAEDEELMPTDSLYGQHYSVGGLAQRLRQDRTDYQNAMEGRRGAWATLLSLFRLVYDGGGSTEGYLPARHGDLFDPETYPFLEGRTADTSYTDGPLTAVPAISDDVVEQVLTKLLLLDGQILSYRALDVEQIGSVYEGIMGFMVEKATGPSVGITYNPPRQKIKITVVVNAEQLLAQNSSKREAWLDEQAGVKLKLPAKVKQELKTATTLAELCVALDKKLSPHTPRGLQAGALILQPTAERRRSGSHYTPRALTEPIVAEAFRPWLERCNHKPTAEQILALKVCDPAMGSGAFLVAVCRYLADWLVQAWEHDGYPEGFRQEWDKDIVARRLIAQRCLYGVDKNPFAVNLAKLSLWLVTLSENLPFTFVDHALKCGDSLVGYGVQEIQGAMKEVQLGFLNEQNQVFAQMGMARRESFGDDSLNDEGYDRKKVLLQQQIKASDGLRQAGDLMVAAFFDAAKAKDRADKQQVYLAMLSGAFNDEGLQDSIQEIRDRLAAGDKGITPFHWNLEFPEVFGDGRGGFDAFVGNPPFAGKNTIAEGSPEGILDWFKQLHPESHGNADLVAHFFRRCFRLLRPGGSLGLIATNTIAQGDTRSTGLRWICLNGGTIYAARKRYKWPGVAAVVVSVLHLFKGAFAGVKLLEKRPVEQITAFLFANGGHDDPKQLAANAGKSFQGSIVLGMGFTFDDSGPADEDTPGIPSPIATMERLIAKNPKNAEVIFPYIGGEEVNDTPTHEHHRYTIDFRDRGEQECRAQWPELMELLEIKVKPIRQERKPNGEFKQRSPLPEKWWIHAEKRPALYKEISTRRHVLANLFVTSQYTVARLDARQIFANTLNIFSIDSEPGIAVLQSKAHEFWFRSLCSTFGSADAPRYTPSTVFETFPFPTALLNSAGDDPAHVSTRQSLEANGKRYHQFRAELMVANNEGLTSTYNRFHDPAETSSGLLELRRLHGEMDQAVLAAYGWSDVPTSCGFGLDYLDTEDDAQLPDELQERIDSGELFFWEAGDALDFQGQLQAYGAITGRRKLPWRYRWPDAVRDDVLARLLALNAERYEEEVAMGLHSKGGKQAAKAAGAGGASGKRRGRPPKAAQGGETGAGQSEQMGLGL